MSFATVAETIKNLPEACDTRSPSGPCPDLAYYVVGREDRPPAKACLRCVTGVIFYGTNNGKTVTINRLEQ